MIQKERTKEILNLLVKHEIVSIKTLCKELYCSKSTIRRDLLELENENIVRRTRGGVTLIKKVTNEFSDNIRINTNKYEKSIIANLAKEYLHDDMIIFLDSSSTVLAITPYLKDLRNITVITNGIRTAMNLSTMKNIKTYVTGGILKGMSSSLLGNECVQFISQFNADITFISCRYIDKDHIYESDPSQAIPKRYMMDYSNITILLADHTKFNKKAMFKIVPLKKLDIVITDRAPDITTLSEMQKSVEIKYK